MCSSLDRFEDDENSAIDPRSKKYVNSVELKDGRTVKLRPIIPEDRDLETAFFGTLSKQTWRFRFFSSPQENPSENIRFTNLDYSKEIAITGILNEGPERKMIGIGNLIVDQKKNVGEFALVVGDPWQGLGLGEKLTRYILKLAEYLDLDFAWCIAKNRNYRMIKLCKKLGFEIEEKDRGDLKAIFNFL